MLVWLCSSLAAAAIAGWVLPVEPQGGVFALGLLAMVYTLAAFALAGRRATAAALVPLAWVASFGMWLPVTREFGLERLVPELMGLGLGEATAARFATGAVLLASGVVTAAMLYVGTVSGAVFGHVALASALVAAASLSRDQAPSSTLAAAIAWHAAASGSLALWAVGVARAARDGVCPRCSENLQGVRGGACPACRAPLVFTPPPRVLPAPEPRTGRPAA